MRREREVEVSERSLTIVLLCSVVALGAVLAIGVRLGQAPLGELQTAPDSTASSSPHHNSNHLISLERLLS